MESNIIIQAAAVTAFVKPIVDAMKKTPIPTPPWSIVPMVLVFGVIIAFFIALTTDAEITRQSIATCVLTGLSGGGGAIAVTELQRNVDG